MGGIARHVPTLRRLARALAGGRGRADAYVGAALKALIDEPLRLVEDGGDTRIVLYRAFYRVWVRMAGAGEDPGEAETAIDRRLQALVPMERLVLLLSTLEGFSDEDIGRITDQSPRTVRRLIDKARALFEQVRRARVLIIEDDWLIAADLKSILESMGHTVVGIATRADTAVAQARLLKPGLILSDVALDRDRGGIEAVDAILRAFPVPVVFVTGHGDRLLKGVGPGPAWVVGKPYDEDGLKAVVTQALHFGAGASRG